MHPAHTLIDDVHADSSVDGSQSVLSGIRVRVLGTIRGDLRTEAGSLVELFGTVGGRLHGEGRVNIYDGAVIEGAITGDGVRDRRQSVDARTTTPGIGLMSRF